MKKKSSAGELEIAILNIIRKKGRATVHEVCSRLVDKRKYTTVMTVMTRLFEKGELDRTKIGHSYAYAVNPQSPTDTGLLKRLKNKIFGGKSATMVAYLLETDESISRKELDELEALIEKRKNELLP